MKKIIAILLAAVLLLCLSGCGGTETVSAAPGGETRIQDLKDGRIGVLTGSVQSIMLPQMLPDAVFTEYITTADAAIALNAGRIDAFSTEESVYLAMVREGHKFTRIDEPVFFSDYGMLFGKGSDPGMHEKFNAFLASGKEDGSLTRLQEKWFGASEPEEFLGYDHLTGEAGTLQVGIDSSMKPFTYIKNNSFAGFDVELLILFAQEYGYQLEFEDNSFTGLLSGVESGRYDIVCSGTTITEERKETMTFSDPYFREDLVLVMMDTASAGEKTLDDFQNAVLGVIDGSLYDGFSRTLFPNARIDSYPSFTDLFQCVKQGKIDGFLLDIPNFSAVQRTDQNLSYITVPGYSVEIGIAFGKNETGDRLQSQMNEFLGTIRADGRYDQLWETWCADTEPTKTPEIPDFSDNETELNICLDLSRKPFVYLLNNEYAGFEVELMYQFCEEYGYNPKFESASWTAGVAGLKEEKYDVVSCGIYMTQERKESVNFCDPYVVADVIMVTYSDGADTVSLWDSLKESFEKTFIREDRWKLIVEGVINTLIISVFAAIGGTVFGFCLYLLARSKYAALSRIIKAAAKVYGRIISGTPTLVVLMILFYIVFGKSDISGILVAVLGFALTFGAFVYSHLALSVEGVDRGQTEAAYALGYTRNQTFFRIILPQAMKIFLPTYSGEIVGMIKATSVVGYIAVTDLTKMGDIIRSNTYEAFFPLIAVALIYFVITWGAAGLLGILQKKLDFRKRKKENILKGVVR